MKEKESIMLSFLYHTFLGRLILKMITRRGLSKLIGSYMSSSLSKHRIKRFVKSNKIDLTDYECDSFHSFNDFFTRKIKEGRRPISKKKDELIAPCDGRLLVYPIKKDLIMPIKQSKYSVSSLLKNEELASLYQNGLCLVFRLCVDNYHRYCYIDDGKKEKNIYIPGILHTVRPIALERYPIFTENSREYTIIHTKNFGDIIQMEVGALLVGKIDNYHQEKEVKRGEEKGKFLFGGSTIIVLIKKEQVKIEESILKNSENGIETNVKMGQVIAYSKEKK